MFDLLFLRLLFVIFGQWEKKGFFNLKGTILLSNFFCIVTFNLYSKTKITLNCYELSVSR